MAFFTPFEQWCATILAQLGKARRGFHKYQRREQTRHPPGVMRTVRAFCAVARREHRRSLSQEPRQRQFHHGSPPEIGFSWWRIQIRIHLTQFAQRPASGANHTPSKSRAVTDTRILRDPEGKRVDEMSKTPDQVETRIATQHFFQAQGPVNVTQKSWATTGEVDRPVQFLLQGLRIYLQ